MKCELSESHSGIDMHQMIFPHVVQVYSIYIEGGQAYVMPFDQVLGDACPTCETQGLCNVLVGFNLVASCHCHSSHCRCKSVK